MQDWQMIGVVAANTIAVIVFWFGWFKWYHGRKEKHVLDPGSRKILHGEMTNRDFTKRYEARLGRVLDGLDGIFGKGAFHPAGIGVCFGLSLVYTAGSLVAGWGLGGPGNLGDVAFLPPLGNPVLQAVSALGLVVMMSVLAIGVWKSEATDRMAVAWLGRWPVLRDRGALAPWVYRGLGAMPSLGMGTWLGLSGDAGSWGLIILWWGMGVGVVFGWSSVALTVALAVTVVVSLATAVSFAVVGAGAAAAIVAQAGAIPVTISVVIAVVLFGGAANTELASGMLFLLILPLINGALDWLSLGASRFLGRHLQKGKRQWWEILGHGVADLVIAGTTLVVLAWVLAFAVQGYNYLAATPEVPVLFDLGAFLGRVAGPDATLGDRFWVGFLLVSTLAPTAAHLAMVAYAWVAMVPGKGAGDNGIAAILGREGEGAVELVEAGRCATWFALRWTLAVLVAVAGLAALAYGVALVAQTPLAEILKGIAEGGIAAADALWGV